MAWWVALAFGNLYQSVQQLSQTYIQPGISKDLVLKPNICTSETPLLLPNTVSFSKRPTFYLCASSNNYAGPHAIIADNPNALCPFCRTKMSVQAQFVAPAADDAKKQDSDNGGFVKGLVTYMVMDNLEVTPMSTISCISLINKLNVQELGALEERVVDFGITEVCYSCHVR